MRIFLYSYILLIFVVLSGCKQTEYTEGVTAEITAAQIEGRNAARDLISQDFSDSAKFQMALLETKAKQSRYLIDGKPECAQEFDSAFIKTVKVVKPELAKRILNNN